MDELQIGAATPDGASGEASKAEVPANAPDGAGVKPKVSTPSPAPFEPRRLAQLANFEQDMLLGLLVRRNHLEIQIRSYVEHVIQRHRLDPMLTDIDPTCAWVVDLPPEEIEQRLARLAQARGHKG